ncbi:MAG TPA: ABC transporter ATP-binding protein [Candidatus Saccharimonadales bacterium]|nr:ABC transporter ATP-binding protein [Candidatus Saccharimonadales bacterium]
MQGSTIRASELSVVRGGIVVLSRLTFGISPGRLTGLIGPSGSGKTTLIRSIVGAQKITGGSLKVLGKKAGSKSLRPHIGYVSQNLSVYGDLTVNQNLKYFAVILGKKKSDIKNVLKKVDLEPQAKQIVATLSGGQKARVSLAVALLSDAEILILDEPTVGLDPLLRKKLWSLFRHLADEGHTLLISSHVMDEAEKCDDIMLLRDGKILKFDTRADILYKTGTRSVEDAFLKLVENRVTSADSQPEKTYTVHATPRMQDSNQATSKAEQAHHMHGKTLDVTPPPKKGKD